MADSTRIQEQIIQLRILLQNVCDGFDNENFNKKTTLTMRTKVLYVISRNENCTPSTLINTLGIAKSNLALLCKGLCDDGVIETTKSDGDKGERELVEFYFTMASDLKLTAREQKSMEKKFDDIINFLNKKVNKQ